MSIRTHTFTAKLSASAHENLNTCLEQQRQLWNAALQERNDAYRKKGKSITFYDQCKSLTAIRADAPEFECFMAVAQRTVLKALDLSYKSYLARVERGEKAGHPRFKGKNRRVRSLEIPKPIIKRSGKFHSVFVKGIGRLRFKGELPEGEYRMMRIVKTPLRVKLQFVVEHKAPVVQDDREPIGIDAGVKDRMILSNGVKIPKIEIDQGPLKRKQRAAARTQKGSKGREKKVEAVRREYQRITECIRGLTHEQTAALIKEYSSKFFVEDLNIPNMTASAKGTVDKPGKNVKQKSGLNRSIHDQRWGDFMRKLTYKAEEAGGFVEKVTPRNTTQRCAACGGMPDEKLTLKVRDYRCVHCGHEADRDVNAANNVLQIGKALKPGGNAPACGKDAKTNGDGVPSAQNGVHDSLGESCI